MDDLRDALVGVEELFWMAADGEVYRRHMAEEGLLVFPFGTLDRSAVSAMLDRSPAGWTDWTFEDVHVLQLGPDTAALSYRTSARHEGGEPYEAWMSSVYVRREGAWLLALHQQTPLEA